MAKAKKMTAKKVGLKFGFRSGLETTIAAQLRANGIEPNYEANRVEELYKATWNVVEYRPDGIVSGAELWDEIEKPISYGLSYPWQTLTDLTYGIRPAEVIVFGAGTGMGKTEFFKEIEAHLLLEHKQNVGIIHLEEQTRETVLGLMSKHSSNNWRLIPQEDHLNHALVHYLAYILGDTQDSHVEHCMCRLMMAYSTKCSAGFSYNKPMGVVK